MTIEEMDLLLNKQVEPEDETIDVNVKMFHPSCRLSSGRCFIRKGTVRTKRGFFNIFHGSWLVRTRIQSCDTETVRGSFIFQLQVL